MEDTASYTIGPVVMVAGVNATESEAIGKNFIVIILLVI